MEMVRLLKASMFIETVGYTRLMKEACRSGCHYLGITVIINLLKTDRMFICPITIILRLKFMHSTRNARSDLKVSKKPQFYIIEIPGCPLEAGLQIFG
jgi:hypothetical protein